MWRSRAEAGAPKASATRRNVPRPHVELDEFDMVVERFFAFTGAAKFPLYWAERDVPGRRGEWQPDGAITGATAADRQSRPSRTVLGW
jgi:hypothetical protein